MSAQLRQREASLPRRSRCRRERYQFCPEWSSAGTGEVTIDGSKGVLEYDENLIRINMGKMVACFFGRNLNIKCFNLESLVIEGYITSIEFLA